MSATTPLISVIVPIYNVAPWLPEALDSLLAQTYTNWEAILVDDKSTDNSAEIMRAYAAKDSRFRYIFRETNSGWCPTPRNNGMDIMKGDYFTFFDPDDILYPWVFETRLKTMMETGADIVEDCLIPFEDGEPAPQITKETFALTAPFTCQGSDVRGFVQQFLTHRNSAAISINQLGFILLWNKLYSSRFAQLRFRNILGEDTAFNLTCIQGSNATLVQLPSIGVAYRQRASSKMHQLAKHNGPHFLDSILSIMKPLPNRLSPRERFPILSPIVDVDLLLTTTGLLYWTKPSRSSKKQRCALRKRCWQYFRLGGLRMRHATPPVRLLFLLFALTGWRRPLRYIPKIPGLTVYVPFTEESLCSQQGVAHE